MTSDFDAVRAKHILFSRRMELEKEYDQWCEENSILGCLSTSIVFLMEKGMICMPPEKKEEC